MPTANRASQSAGALALGLAVAACTSAGAPKPGADEADEPQPSPPIQIAEDVDDAIVASGSEVGRLAYLSEGALWTTTWAGGEMSWDTSGWQPPVRVADDVPDDARLLAFVEGEDGTAVLAWTPEPSNHGDFELAREGPDGWRQFAPPDDALEEPNRAGFAFGVKGSFMPLPNGRTALVWDFGPWGEDGPYDEDTQGLRSAEHDGTAWGETEVVVELEADGGKLFPSSLQAIGDNRLLSGFLIYIDPSGIDFSQCGWARVSGTWAPAAGLGDEAGCVAPPLESFEHTELGGAVWVPSADEWLVLEDHAWRTADFSPELAAARPQQVAATGGRLATARLDQGVPRTVAIVVEPPGGGGGETQDATLFDEEVDQPCGDGSGPSYHLAVAADDAGFG